MGFCSKCGTKFDENGRFCSKCGEPVRRVTVENSTEGLVVDMYATEKLDSPVETVITETQESTSASVEELKPAPIKVKGSGLKKSHWIAIFSGIFVVVLGLGLFMLGNFLFSRDRIVKNFKQAFSSGDVNKLSKYLISSDPNLKIDSSTLKPLAECISKDPDWAKQVLASIDKQSKGTLEGGWNGDIMLRKNGKKFLIFDNYVFEVRPFYVELFMDFKGTEVNIGNLKTVTSSEDNKFEKAGPFVPGLYDVKTSFKGLFATKEATSNLRLSGSFSEVINSERDVSVRLPVGFDDLKYVSVYSDYDDAKVFVNDKDTGLLVRDAEKVGPVDGSAQIYLVRSVNGSDIKSEYVTPDYRTAVYIDFPEGSGEVQTGASPVFGNVTASSELLGDSVSHKPALAADGTKDTAWVEGVSGDGVGEWVMLGSSGSQSVSGLKIMNGYSKGSDIYQKNNRVASVTLEFSDGSTLNFNLNDGVLDFQTLDFGKTISTSYIKVTITSVYKGSKYQDTCISEMQVY